MHPRRPRSMIAKWMSDDAHVRAPYNVLIITLFCNL